MNMIKLFGKPVRVNKASAHQKNLDVGANIFIGINFVNVPRLFPTQNILEANYSTCGVAIL